MYQEKSRCNIDDIVGGDTAKPSQLSRKRKNITSTTHIPWQHHTTVKSSFSLQQTLPISMPTQSHFRDENSIYISPLPLQTMKRPIRCANASGS